MKKSKYHEIKTADELQEAIAEVRRSIKRQEETLTGEYYGIRNHFTPANMVVGFLKKNSNYYNWADMSLRLVRLVKDKVDQRNLRSSSNIPK